MRLTCFLALTCAVLERSHAIAESEVALTSDIAPVSRILQPNAQSAEYSSERKSLRSRDSPEEEATALLATDEQRELTSASLLAPLLDNVENVVKKISSTPSQVMPVQLKPVQPKFDQLKPVQLKLNQLKPPQPVPGQFELHVPPHQIRKRTSTMQRTKRVVDLVAYGQGKARPRVLLESSVSSRDLRSKGARLVDVDGSKRIRARLSLHVTLRAAWALGKCGPAIRQKDECLDSLKAGMPIVEQDDVRLDKNMQPADTAADEAHGLNVVASLALLMLLERLKRTHIGKHSPVQSIGDKFATEEQQFELVGNAHSYAVIDLPLAK
ncbi:unnamed protein product [Hyaloperonospora brassicae]|uniref:RxLR effector candidate protein n=1 Tax=Hyaloperonospora brassicae TaxID=162125 RepID=A0AAV0V449_HYABA|nr:unnamed protein product [Hyaloperonospora brassicae]